MTFREALLEGTKKLSAHHCDGADAGLECEALLTHAAKLTRERLFMSFDTALSAAEARRFSALIARRAKHEPLAWLLGTGWFMGREFEVNRNTLIPRPATEHVVEAAVAAARTEGANVAIDVGTGSGCIAVTLALELPSVRVIATDLSIAAVTTARRNARRHGVISRFTLRKTNLLGLRPVPDHASSRPIPLAADATPIIVANLPYLPTAMRRTMSKCVLREPASALFSGKDGLDASCALLHQLSELPNKKMIVAYEILAKQFVPLSAELRRAFPGAKPQRIKNYEGTTVGLLAILRK
jgi:release factor glutamine methyltransferase